MANRILKYLSDQRKQNKGYFVGWSLKILAAVYDKYNYWKWLNSYKNDLGLSGDDLKRNLMLGVEYAYMSGVEGDIAEFGTMSGRSAKIQAEAMNGYDSSVTKALLLFDSFEGLPEIDAIIDRSNPFVVSGGWQPGRLLGLPPEQLVRVVRKSGLDRSRIKVYPGWFKDTVSALPADTWLAVLHIDGDLYQSAIDVLDTCFSRGFIAEGAMTFFDDWNVAAASPDYGERRAWAEMVNKYGVKYDDEGGYAWNAHKFIVHSYDRTV